jgi:hypothetical protein
LFSAVNDPSEVVRAASAIRVLVAGPQEYRAEALRSSRDESEYVREKLLNYFVTAPQADQRIFIAQNLLDPVPAVRRAAMGALAKQAAVATVDEWSALRNEADPSVLLAVADYCEARGTKLSEAVRAQFNACPDPEVKARAARLP